MKNGFLLLCIAVLASCSQRTEESFSSLVAAASESREGEKLERKYKSQAASGFKQDQDGKWVTDSSKRSSFELESRNNMAGRQFNAKNFSKRDTIKPAEWSKAEYKKVAYTGNTDGAAFKKNSAMQGILASESGSDSGANRKRVQTNALNSHSAIEQNRNPVKTNADARTQNHRNYEKDILIMDYQQMRDMSIQQTKSIMGR